MIQTSEQAFVAFLHGINREDAEGVGADKFNWIINKAQEDWITERANQFDQNQKRIDDLFILREERIIPTNSFRNVVAACSLRLFSGGVGTMVIQDERYFNISGLSFFKKSSDTGNINQETGEVTGATVGDIFYAIINYSELPTPVMVKLSVLTAVTGIHVGTLLTQSEIVVACASASITISNYWTVEEMLPIMSTTCTDTRFLIPNGFPNPKYFRLLNVMFKINYKDNTLFEDGESTWLRAKIMRADQRDAIMRSPYLKPTDEKSYYRFIGDFIELITNTASTPVSMKLEYLRYPKTIVYTEPDSTETAVDCELHAIQQKEIVDMAVRYYIEATKDDRYQTQVAEATVRKANE